ncbi:MAG: 2-amino-4-hydroxy-6-hydroxymethyldihydropteridine diphosphokinase [Bacillota bacterium]
MQNSQPIVAYVGIGSNLGDREANIRRAVDMLRQTPQVQVQRVSKLLDNPAQGGPENAPRFLNAAAEVRTTLKPADLLKRLLEIEQVIGRRRHIKWEPRVIDLDLLLYGNSILSTESLIVPHPLMHERRFVLEPLAEIAPNAVHPVVHVTVATLLQNLAGGKISGATHS